jgi:transcriptional regulator with XRE-family HTH domain
MEETQPAMDEWTPLLGQRIRDRRLAMGMTLQTLGERVGKHRAHLSQIENGISCPSSHLLFKICRALNRRMDYFYGPIKARIQARP